MLLKKVRTPVKSLKMIDRFLYNFFGGMDNFISKIETYSVKLTSWCWQSRVNLLNKKRRKKNVK